MIKPVNLPYVNPTSYNGEYNLKCALDFVVAGIEILPNTYILKPNKLRKYGKQDIKKTSVYNIDAVACNVLHNPVNLVNWYRYIDIANVPFAVVINNINSIAYSSPTTIYGNLKYLIP
jgi:hypothetical protein